MDRRQTQPRSQEGQRAAGERGGGQGGRARTTTQREINNAVFDMGEQFVFLIFNALPFSEAGRKLLMSDAATKYFVVFAVSLAVFNHLALILRLYDNSYATVVISYCSAFLRIMIFMSLLGTFVHDKMPWITYAPLICLPLLLLSACALAGQRTAAGGDVDGREISNAMLAITGQILMRVVAAFLATEEGRQLIISEAATPHLIVFVLSVAGFKLIHGLDFPSVVSADYIDDCYAFLKVTMFMSLIGTFMHNKIPWITCTPLLFLLFLLLRALVHIYSRWGLDNDDSGHTQDQIATPLHPMEVDPEPITTVGDDSEEDHESEE